MRDSRSVDVQETKLQFHTVPLNLRLFPEMQVFAWTVLPLLISGICVLNYYFLLRINPEHGATCYAINTERHSNEKTMKQSNTSEDLGWKNVDCVNSNAKLFRFHALLPIFEDNEAAIEMIIKGRSPTMRHVSRTQGVALDWVFYRINLGPKSQIKYVDTKNQLADIFTKGSFTCDEWNHLLCLFNIVNHSMLLCGNFSQISDLQVMSKRQMQEGKNSEKRSAWLHNRDLLEIQSQ